MSDTDETKPPLMTVPAVDTSDHRKLLHETEMGQRIRVDRDGNVTSDLSREAHHNLLTIGQFLKENDHAIKHCDYVGSAAVHIYQSEILGEIFFFTQTSTLCGTNEMTASNAWTELGNRMKQYYGRKPGGAKRSGW